MIQKQKRDELYQIEGRVVDGNGLLTRAPEAPETYPPFPDGPLADHLREFFRGFDRPRP